MAKTVVGLFPSDKQVLSEVLDDLARKTIPAENVSSVRTQPSSALEEAGKGAFEGRRLSLARHRKSLTRRCRSLRNRRAARWRYSSCKGATHDPRRFDHADYYPYYALADADLSFLLRACNARVFLGAVRRSVIASLVSQNGPFWAEASAANEKSKGDTPRKQTCAP